MAVSMKVLETTMIGKSVSSLQSHASKDIRNTARMLIRGRRLTVGGESNKINPPIDQQCLRPPLVPRKFNVVSENPKKRLTTPCASLETKKLQNPKKSEKVEEKRSNPCASLETKRLQNPRKSIVLDNKKSVEEKLEAAKRKLEEGYKEAHNAKRLRRTQVIEVGDVLRLGLVPKQQQAL
ncbi:hypothetical protein L1987_74124 [Smallanthus sonchifolius]|uniref:Uncharacterized protein n=1 Tax=Smallanthus sonchifolius TaxID=185202 RepID=A0ACB9A274_9ASTR|nr:hypothetical protein L1987_74124 [Smallanthus sonchifolius]